jgi:chromosomal replication initiator protein
MDIERIEQVTSEVTGISPERMREKTRKREIVTARHLVYYFTEKLELKTSLSVIGGRYGQDHCTVLHGRKTIVNHLYTKDDTVCTLTRELSIWLSPVDFNSIPQY